MSRTYSFGAVTCTVSALALPSSPASAQGVPEVKQTFPEGTEARIHGQINKGFLVHDDGIESKAFSLIDNANTGTRVGLA